MTATANGRACVALLIDADNLSADVIEQALAHLMERYGAIQFRRAYCSPQKMTEHLDLFRRHSIRPMINVPTGKNSTDIALAVDAIDLAFTEQPDVVVIASSDSDYAPLAMRLRERGCRVMGIGQAGKTGVESPLAYDEFVQFDHHRAVATSRAAPRPAAKAPARRARAPNIEPQAEAREIDREAARAPARVAAPAPPAVAAPTPVPSRRAQPPARAAEPAPVRAPAASPPSATLPDEVQRILQAVPSLRGGSEVLLNGIGEQLRKHDLLTSKSASPSRLLKRFPSHFELMPIDKPRTVRFRASSSR
ncbi:hypothetical protein BH11PSE9_BH11PSE9_32690 [soil metagenome]